MAKINPLHLEHLRAITLVMAGVKKMSPQECRNLSFLVFERTRMIVSETSLKRFFGYEDSKFDPSLFTLNALSLFCGFENWENFPKPREVEAIKADDSKISIVDDPLVCLLIETGEPTAILKVDAPNFTLLNYNKAFEVTTFTQKRNVRGLTWWEAFDPNLSGGAGATQLMEAFRETLFTSEMVKMEPLHYNILSATSNVVTFCWWDIKIAPVKYDGFTKYLLVHVHNITDKIIHHVDIERAIMKELTMAEDLAITNVKLSASIKNLAESHDELMSTKKQLEEVNSYLEKRVFERTKKLFESEANQRELIDNAPVAIGVLKGPEHVVETANKKLIEYWAKDHTVVGKALAVALPELEGQPFIGILDEVRRTGVAYVNPELRALLNFNGVVQPRYFDMVYHPIQYQPGITERIFIVAVDITEHVTALKKLQQSESMLRLAVEAADIGIWALDPVEKTLSYDPNCAKLLGWDGDETMTYHQVISQISEEFREAITEAIEDAISSDGTYDFTYSQKRFNDGEVIWLRGTGKITLDDSGNHKIFSGVIRKISGQDMEAGN